MALVPFIKPEQRWIQENGKPVQPFGLYMSSLDQRARNDLVPYDSTPAKTKIEYWRARQNIGLKNAAYTAAGCVTPFDFGGKGDFFTDDTAALQAAIATNQHVDLCLTDWRTTATLVLRTSKRLFNGTITKGVSGIDVLDMSNSECVLSNVYVFGGGSGGFTGRGIIIGGGSYQRIEGCHIQDCDGYALEFTAADAGTSFISLDSDYARTISTNYAVKLPSNDTTLGGLRYFNGCENRGFYLIDLSGSHFTIITDSNTTGMAFRDITNGANVSNTRMAFLPDLRGAAINLQQNVIKGPLTIKSDCTSCFLSGNTMQGGSIVIDSGVSGAVIHPGDAIITDNAGVAGNKLYQFAQTFTPVWSSTGVQPALGGGGDSLTGRAAREGNLIKIGITLAFSGATTLGTGVYKFQAPLPFAIKPASGVALGTAYFFDASTGFEYRATSYIDSTSLDIFLSESLGAANYWGAARPVVPAAGDLLHLDIEFQCGA